jgi:hypothetical protein
MDHVLISLIPTLAFSVIENNGKGAALEWRLAIDHLLHSIW